MRIWLLHVGEELPGDDQPRRFRYGYLADALAQKGHQVLRWAPTFQHACKIQRFTEHTRLNVNDRYSIQFVYAPGYRSNASLARWQCYRRLALEFRKLAPQYERPDLIVTGIPSLEWCEAAIRFGRRHHVPTVVDVRDLWPDVMLNAVPRQLRPLGRLALTALFRQSRWNCRHADAITAVSHSYLDWALQHAGRTPRKLDQVYPLGYEAPTVSDEQRRVQLEWLRSQGVDSAKTICCYTGLFENSYDVESIVNAARQLHESGQGRHLQFVLCGDGSKMKTVRQLASGLPNVVILGWVKASTITVLLEIARIGIAAYAPHALQSLPNKVFEYMSGGLAIVSSLQGEMAKLLEKHQIGATYLAGDFHDLASVVLTAVHSADQLKKMCRGSRQLFDAQYRVETLYDQFSNYLEDVALKHQHRQAHSLNRTVVPFAADRGNESLVACRTAS